MKCYRCSAWPCVCKDKITILHGNCAEIMPDLGQFDLLLTDPPYGIDAARNARGGKQHGAAIVESKDYGAADWDKQTSPEGVKIATEKTKWQIVFGGNYYSVPPSSCWLVWDKDNGDNGYADCELAWTNLEKAVRKFKWRWHGMLQERGGDKKEIRYHPTQKPLALMRWCIKQAPSDVQTVLDPFMGSGTTLRAAKDEGMAAVGIEIDERWCEVAVKRLEQGVLF